MYTSILALAVFVVSSFTLLEHGNEGLGLTRIYQPHELPLTGPEFENAPISLEGTLEYNEELSSYVLTDPATSEGAPLKGLPDADFEALVGEHVHVHGKYIDGFQHQYHIDVEIIRSLSTTSASPGPAS
jgi:hypothetical protein